MNYDSDYEIRLATLEAMGGDVTKEYDSVYDIDLEILRLTEEGGGSGKAIEEVSELPNASENKDKLFRLDNSEKDVYAAKLLSSETITTNRLPDEQQIDKAYLWVEDDEPYYYKGAWKLILNDGEINGYGWLETYPDNEQWYLYLTPDDAVNVTPQTKCYLFGFDEVNDFDLENHTITMEADVADYSWEYAVPLTSDGVIPIPAIYNAPESAQIDNAYINYDGDNYIYTGEQGAFYNSDDEEVVGYIWKNGNLRLFTSNKKASEIYGDFNNMYYDFEVWDYDGIFDIITPDSIYIPQLNAPDSEQVDNAYITVNDNINCQYEGNTIDVHINNDIVTMYVWEDSNQDYIFGTEVNASNVYGERQFAFCRYDEDYHYWEGNYNLSVLGFTISSINTIKYQRTETTEDWGWQDIIPNYASDSDIDAMFESPVVKRVLMSDYASPLSIKEGLVNVSGETMEYDGQTYYKWVKYEEHNGESVIDDYGTDTELVVLTTSLNPSLPFNDESPEYAYHLVIDGNEGQYWGLDTYPKEALIHEDGSITYEE